MKIAIVLNQPRDIALAAILYKTAPVHADIVLSNFNVTDEFNWVIKRKSLDAYFDEVCLQDAINVFGNDLYIARNVHEFKTRVSSADLCISKGREFFVLKMPTKKNIAISADGCYLNRLLDAQCYFYGKKRLKIALDSKRWIEQSFYNANNVISCHTGIKYGQNFIDQHTDGFLFFDVLGQIANDISETDITEFRQRLGVNDNQKIAFLSLRSADQDMTVHDSHESFTNATLELLQIAKDNNMFVIARRRLAQIDKATRRGYPEIEHYNKFAPFIDAELNGSTGYPPDLWLGLKASAALLLPDISSIADTEAVLCHCPTIMTSSSRKRAQEKIRHKNNLSSRFQQFIGSAFQSNLYDKTLLTDLHRTSSDVNRLKKFALDWYNTDIDAFWQSALCFGNDT